MKLRVILSTKGRERFSLRKMWIGIRANYLAVRLGFNLNWILIGTIHNIFDYGRGGPLRVCSETFGGIRERSANSGRANSPNPRQSEKSTLKVWQVDVRTLEIHWLCRASNKCNTLSRLWSCRRIFRHFIFSSTNFRFPFSSIISRQISFSIRYVEASLAICMILSNFAVSILERYEIKMSLALVNLGTNFKFLVQCIVQVFNLQWNFCDVFTSVMDLETEIEKWFVKKSHLNECSSMLMVNEISNFEIEDIRICR